MGFLLRLIFRPIGLMLFGIATTVLGVNFSLLDPEAVPAKAELKQVAGVLDKATKVTTKRRTRTSINYELEIKDRTGEIVKLILPEREIGEDQVTGLFGQPVIALYSGEKDVWELSAGGRKVIEYEATKTRRQDNLAVSKASGPYVAGGGLLGLLLGLFWWRRRGSL